MRNVEVTLAAGVGLLLVAGAVTLTHSPPRIVRSVALNELGRRGEHPTLTVVTADAAVCQAGEVLPRGVSGIRLWLVAFYGAPVRVAVYSGSRVLTEGRRGANWTGQSVTVPVKPVGQATAHVRLCFAVAPNSEPIGMLGASAPARERAVISGSATPRLPVTASDGRVLAGKAGVEYLAAGTGSWWSRVLAVARHMGLGRAFSGTWIALLVAALTATVGVLAVRTALRELP